MWEDRRLRDIAEADIRLLVNSGLEEHLQLEYKSALYTPNDNGNKESLLDICMFANAGGGILLIGVNEQRDNNGQPTGAPDPNSELGVELPNPEQLLQSYDARVTAGIDERLPLESYAIPVVNNRHVVAIRVANSTSRPHRVHYQGRVYFPSRRERSRYEMDVREIKEMVMRTASRIEAAEAKLRTALQFAARGATNPANVASVVIGCVPVFWQNFMIDVQQQAVIQAAGWLHGLGNQLQPTYDFHGLMVDRQYTSARVQRDGTVTLTRDTELMQEGGRYHLRPVVIEIFLRGFVQRCAAVYRAASVTGPFLLSMVFHTNRNTWGLFPSVLGEDPGDVMVVSGNYPFPVLQADNLLDVDRVIRPVCDQAHQMFGRSTSPSFDTNGIWNRRE